MCFCLCYPGEPPEPVNVVVDAVAHETVTLSFSLATDSPWDIEQVEAHVYKVGDRQPRAKEMIRYAPSITIQNLDHGSEYRVVIYTRTAYARSAAFGEVSFATKSHPTTPMVTTSVDCKTCTSVASSESDDQTTLIIIIAASVAGPIILILIILLLVAAVRRNRQQSEFLSTPRFHSTLGPFPSPFGCLLQFFLHVGVKFVNFLNLLCVII